MSDLKNRERFTTSIDKKILSEFKEISKNTRIPMSKLLDEALELIVQKYSK